MCDLERSLRKLGREIQAPDPLLNTIRLPLMNNKEDSEEKWTSANTRCTTFS